MVPLCRQLATSYSAGIPILRSLELAGRNARHTKLREVVTHIHDDIGRGSTLADAARSQTRYLPVFFTELLSSGESGGKIDVMLRDLADYYEDRLQMRRAVIGKMIYPGIQLTLAWFLGTFALMLIRRLDFISGGFDFEGYLRFYAAFQAGAMAVFATIFAVCVILARLGIFQWIWGYVATYVWPLAAVTRRFGTARFFRSMSLLIGSGMPIMRCIEASAAVTANPYLERDFLKAVPLVKDGATLVEAFAPSQFLSAEAREMLRVGEESGKLEDSLNKVAEYQSNEAMHAVDVAARVGQVVISLTVAIVVGYIVISFYSGYLGKIDEITNM